MYHRWPLVLKTESPQPYLQIPLAPPEWYIRQEEIEKDQDQDQDHALYEIDYSIKEDDPSSSSVIIIEM